MQFSRGSIKTSVITVLVMFGLVSVASADTIYTAVLDGVYTGSGSPATGLAILTLNPAETEVSYVIEFTELIGTETGAHIHNGGPGLIGSRLLVMALGSPKTGIWPVNAYAVAELNAGRVYINIHTDTYTTGEIGGQVAFDAVAAESQAWGAVKAFYR